MKIEQTNYAGWQDCYRLSNDQLALTALVEVGPRIIQLGPDPSRNCFFVDPASAGRSGGDQWNVYGGHRLWHAPESMPRTYQPDNHPANVLADEATGTLTLTQSVEAATGIEKQIVVRLDDDRPHVTLTHRLRNTGLWPVTLAPWALSVMAPGGTGILALPPRGSHDENLLPAGGLVMWAYVDMADARYTWGHEHVLLRQDPAATTPQKIGLTASRGWAAYSVDDLVFVKTFEEIAGAPYPDQGCLVELFTNPSMLEVETLGPLTTIEPQEAVEHREEWWLLSGVPAIRTEEDIQKHLLPRLDGLM